MIGTVEVSLSNLVVVSTVGHQEGCRRINFGTDEKVGVVEYALCFGFVGAILVGTEINWPLLSPDEEQGIERMEYHTANRNR